MKSIAAAQALLFAAAQPLTTSEWVSLETAAGRIVATDIYACQAVPPAANSAMDGYALAHEDWRKPLMVSQRILAGAAPAPLAAGTAARIFTGAEIPAGANVVVMQENTRIEGDRVLILVSPEPNDNIRPQGQDVALGSLVLAKGTRLGAVELGLLASQGRPTVEVITRLKIALVTSGNELVNPGEPLTPGQIYNTNGICTHNVLAALGGEVSSYSLADNAAASRALLLQLAAVNQLIITTGGVSAGDEDHIKTAIAELGVINLWQVAMKPGKPLMFGHIQATPILGLPGNPVSALVTLLMFGKPFIERLQGSGGLMAKPYRLPLLSQHILGGERAEFLRVRRTAQGLEPFNNQSSGVLRSLAWADGLALLPANAKVAPGETVDYWSLDDLMTPR